MSTADSQTRRTVLTIAGLVVALLVYFTVLGRMALGLVSEGKPAAVGLGIGVAILPLLGLWSVVATLRAAFSQQRLAAHMRAAGRELEVSTLPRRRSGRIEPAAADALFAEVQAEYVAAPQDWQACYRVARAYDYAGDRSRARSMMRRAVTLERRDRESRVPPP